MKPKLIIVEMDNGVKLVYPYKKFINKIKGYIIKSYIKEPQFKSAWDIYKRNKLIKGGKKV